MFYCANFKKRTLAILTGKTCYCNNLWNLFTELIIKQDYIVLIEK